MAIGYGSLLFALKNRGQFQETTSDTPTRVEQGKWELFATGGGQHWGIRTGFPTTQIDFMVAREDMTSHPAQMEKLFFEIAQNGFYVPVADTEAKSFLHLNCMTSIERPSRDWIVLEVSHSR